ncbi:dynein light chain Tctex-type 5-like isoform X2 [Aethina tumida]|uniref:dynein light chain Tctex-type 5-like isoform X2 n=1 Tax=Aethina tumida TaxID=116153 RepID=UPI002147E7B2|nr:dynein light chain Tctex-type 5-like isoform X2 [Aethina tumida]
MLESQNPFNAEKVYKILKAVLDEAMENMTYDPEKCANQAKWASNQIKSDVKKLEFDRYKIISLVTFGERHDQDVNMSCSFLWDHEKDNFAMYTSETNTVFGVALCFGIYYE